MLMLLAGGWEEDLTWEKISSHSLWSALKSLRIWLSLITG